MAEKANCVTVPSAEHVASVPMAQTRAEVSCESKKGVMIKLRLAMTSHELKPNMMRS